MTSRKLMSTTEHNNKVAKLVGSKGILDKDLQDLLEDALLQASHPDDGADCSGSCNRLDHIIHSLAGQSSWPMRAIKAYIGAHTTAKWGKLKDGRSGYSYHGNPPSVTMPTVTWWEHKVSNENGSKALTVQVVSRIRAVITDAHKEGATADNPELLKELEELWDKHKKVNKKTA